MRFMHSNIGLCFRCRADRPTAALKLGNCRLAVVRHQAVRALFLAWLGLAGGITAMPAKATGFSGTFDPSTWTVVNTNPANTPQTQTLTSNDYFCSEIEAGNPNDVGCLSGITTNTGSFTLIGSEVDLPGGGPADTLSQTTLKMTNTYWRPYLITFDWSFSGPGGDPLAEDQYARILVNPGFIDTAGSQGYQYESAPGDPINAESAIVYIPPGATLEFSVFTLNNGVAPVFSITGFDAVEVPAPLPLAGSSGVFLFSRRLRRRQRSASSQFTVLGRSSPGPLNLARLRRAQQQRQAIQRYGDLLGRPLTLPPAPLSSQQPSPAGPLQPQPKPLCNAPVSFSDSR